MSLTLGQVLEKVGDLNESSNQLPYDSSITFRKGDISFDWDLTKNFLSEQDIKTKITIAALRGQIRLI